MLHFLLYIDNFNLSKRYRFDSLLHRGGLLQTNSNVEDFMMHNDNIASCVKCVSFYYERDANGISTFKGTSAFLLSSQSSILHFLGFERGKNSSSTCSQLQEPARMSY